MITFPRTYTPTQHLYYGLSELKVYEDYIKRYEKLIKEELDNYNKYLQDDNLYFELGPRFNFQQDHFANLAIEFPNIQRKSALISILSYFENSLNKLCEVFEYTLNLSVNFKDMNGKGLERAKLYLIKIAEINFPNSSSWNSIKKLQRIRNNIIHQYSEIYGEDTQIIDDIKSFQFLSLYPLTTKKLLMIEENFLGTVLKIFEEFYNELLESVKLKTV